jgi:3-dehydroquinate synthase
VDTVNVALGDRSYPIHIGSGLLQRAELVRAHLAQPRVAIVTNDVVGPLYLDALGGVLERAGVQALRVTLPDGEARKNWESLNRILDALLENRCERSTTVIALGGGVIGDLAGFAAAVFLRGVPFIQVPTTLLAQVDSSVGGKTAINHALGKNMIGAFHQPRAVIADVAILDSLPDRELRAGLAEVIKHGLALDEAFTRWLEGSIDKLVARDRTALTYAVRRSCELKAAIVAADERESGARALLNFGHTFGHAIESGAGYGSWLHGEAVAAGMVMASELSMRLGNIQKADVARVRDLIRRAGLPVAGPALAPERMLELMAVDKKAAKGQVRFIVLEAIGRAALRADPGVAPVREAIVAALQ